MSLKSSKEHPGNNNKGKKWKCFEAFASDVKGCFNPEITGFLDVVFEYKYHGPGHIATSAYWNQATKMKAASQAAQVIYDATLKPNSGTLNVQGYPHSAAMPGSQCTAFGGTLTPGKGNGGVGMCKIADMSTKPPCIELETCTANTFDFVLNYIFSSNYDFKTNCLRDKFLPFISRTGAYKDDLEEPDSFDGMESIMRARSFQKEAAQKACDRYLFSQCEA
jgi:hypothetical protein